MSEESTVDEPASPEAPEAGPTAKSPARTSSAKRTTGKAKPAAARGAKSSSGSGAASSRASKSSGAAKVDDPHSESNSESNSNSESTSSSTAKPRSTAKPKSTSKPKPKPKPSTPAAESTATDGPDDEAADAAAPDAAAPDGPAPDAAVIVAARPEGGDDAEPVLELVGLSKHYAASHAADDITLTLAAGTFTGIVGPNGAGKTTTLSMITGLVRPTSGTVRVAGIDVWQDPVAAKRLIGVLPDRLNTFDRLTGGQLLYYTGVLHGLDRATARSRTAELAEAFRVEHAMSRLVTDYSSGMLKKIALAAALIHGPRLLVLDEPFESVDPVSAMTVAQILRDFVAEGGTVLLSSHSMELVQRICDHVAVIVDGRLIAGGTVDEVRGDQSLQERFIELAGSDAESIADLTWLHRFSN